ncbi:hypothetical protein H5410_022084 [Solanum commersonii]|uniref:Helitron helicase-like domain-containing protein n=1 Tax=Solanum commersonii TaxID=4109 RepID=A0A9J5ZCW7_SOLCO|nr:hypothetical protein H5410_022084 [Solanum commersonii]
MAFFKDNRISNHLTHDENEDVDMFAADEFGSGKLYNEDYWDIGDPIYECQYCGAYFWYAERIDKCKKKKDLFSLCVVVKKVTISERISELIIPCFLLHQWEEKLMHLSIKQTKGPRTFRLSGQNYHKIGSLLPNEGSTPKFAQLYIYDTENEKTNRMNVISNNQIHAQIVTELKEMLDKHNVLAKSFRMVRDRFQVEQSTNVKLRLIGRRGSDGRRYNLPSVSEVAALVIGNFEPTNTDRDIIIESQNGQLQRINELNDAYLGLQYPLLLPYGEDGYREDIPLNRIDESSEGRKRVSSCEYFAYKIQERKNEVLQESMFLRWLEANKEFPEARHLTLCIISFKFCLEATI